MDWDRIDQMQQEAVDDLAEITQALRARTLSEDEVRHASLRGQLALNLLQIQPPMSGLPDFLLPQDPAPTEPAQEEPA